MTTANSVSASDAAPDLVRASVDDQKERRRAKAIVNEFLIGVSTPLENRGVGHRLLPGLWQAAVNVLLSTLDINDVLLLIRDRSRGIVGDGSNADAEIRSLGQRGMKIYLKEVETAARTIMETLDEALEGLSAEDLDDRFPETVFDAALQVLLPAWGPFHVRRALAEQSALLIREVSSACNFMEPLRFQQPVAPTKKNLPEAPKEFAAPVEVKVQILPETIPVVEPAPQAIPTPVENRPERRKTGRRVHAFAASDVAASGVAAWVVAMVCHDDDGRAETREISGTLADPSGRMAAIKAVHECLLAACETSSIASIMLETPSDRCVRAASNGGTPGSRLAGEEDYWNDVDRLHAIHRIEIRRAERAVDRDLAERCDRMLRRLMEEK
jgi:ribonuclease HI